jgi:hypothetical protein
VFETHTQSGTSNFELSAVSVGTAGDNNSFFLQSVGADSGVVVTAGAYAVPTDGKTSKSVGSLMSVTISPGDADTTASVTITPLGCRVNTVNSMIISGCGDTSYKILNHAGGVNSGQPVTINLSEPVKDSAVNVALTASVDTVSAEKTEEMRKHLIVEKNAAGNAVGIERASDDFIAAISKAPRLNWK